ncbi:histidine phosphatase family protein [Thioalkalivibrio sp. ALJ1]|uniref:histidine phosphatase family protein n=1 Tax=Thioalkalivibrio sp. ALJ1 TaxID=1158144 RepID=UPI00142F9648|nr:histidine phosphatase family protein [Thioalkalivibrio sp. ALJ1]
MLSATRKSLSLRHSIFAPRHLLMAALMAFFVAASFVPAIATSAPGAHDEPLTIYLVRHGQTDWNKEGRLQGDTDNSLNATGRSQAYANAEALANVQVDHIYPSGLARAIETAEVFAARAPITPLTMLNERSRGKYEGEVAEEVADEFRPRFTDLDDDMDGGESLSSIANRVGLATREIVASHPSGTVMIVGHSGVNPLVIAELIGISPVKAIEEIRQGNDEVIKLKVFPNGHVSMWKMVQEHELEMF